MIKKVNINLTLPNLLTVAFIVLKLLGKITWSWWWVLAPTWGPIVMLLGILGILGLVLVLKVLCD